MELMIILISNICVLAICNVHFLGMLQKSCYVIREEGAIIQLKYFAFRMNWNVGALTLEATISNLRLIRFRSYVQSEEAV